MPSTCSTSLSRYSTISDLSVGSKYRLREVCRLIEELQSGLRIELVNNAG
jgi:hypothetical protein